jgi:hypothetical protein
MKPRRLTVSRTHPESRARFPRPVPTPMPLLRLQGRWMDRAGFGIGKPVRVAVKPGLLVLEVLNAERD